MKPKNICLVESATDPRIAPYVSIREKDLTGRGDGRFIVEGRVTLGILLERSRFDVESLFLFETRVEPLSQILQQVPADVPIYVAPQAVMDEVAGFNVHRGVLACAKKRQSRTFRDISGPQGALKADKTVLVLNQTSNHDNVGAAFRNAAAFGVDRVLLDGRSCDPLYRKSIQVSAGASLWLPFVHDGSGAEHIAGLKEMGFTVWAMTPRVDATPLYEMDVHERLAILLGAEGPGLPDELIDAAVPVRIPMSAGFDSVNVATAGAIALSYVFNARQMR